MLLYLLQEWHRWKQKAAAFKYNATFADNSSNMIRSACSEHRPNHDCNVNVEYLGLSSQSLLTESCETFYQGTSGYIRVSANEPTDWLDLDAGTSAHQWNTGARLSSIVSNRAHVLIMQTRRLTIHPAAYASVVSKAIHHGYNLERLVQEVQSSMLLPQ